MTPNTPPAVSEAMREAVAPTVHEFRINELGGPNIVVEGNTWFVHSHEHGAYKAWAEAEIARITGEREAAQKKLAVATETFTDDDGAVWIPPTAWAYFAACRALKTVQARADAAEADLTRMRAETERLAQIETPRPISEYHEDMGFVLWWILPVREPPYSGSPGCDDWPDYHTHFTPLPDIRDAAWREAYYANPEQTDGR